MVRLENLFVMVEQMSQTSNFMFTGVYYSMQSLLHTVSEHLPKL